MERTDRKKQIAISKQESFELSNEFIKMFCKADQGSEFDCYSMQRIREQYPNITALYHAIVEP